MNTISMSAPQIPNLLSLRGARGGGRSHGRGRGGFHAPSRSNPDVIVQDTDNDASVSRMSAVELGYVNDPYAQYFVRNIPPARRLPIINRGTYTRTTALDRLVFAFLSGHEEGRTRQIVSLGAGTDTRCFRLFSQSSHAGVIYHEIDFPSISTQKLRTVQATTTLQDILPHPESVHSSWRTRHLPNGCQYWCHGLDLRDLLKAEETPALQGLEADVPTLLISEMCLCYLEADEAKDIVKYFTDRIPNLSIILYEPIKPDDPFGRQMVSNLAARRLRLPTLEVYKEAIDQEQRLRDAGFEAMRELTIGEIWNRWIPLEEKERLDELEGLDEVEEWDLLASHYIVAWGWRGTGFEGWGTL